ncbi:MAG: hypothetical protein JNL74_12945, partial [Fibrobacteres bacterium]|nr:hypothetical protein [Fibrobacterota bacterium]
MSISRAEFLCRYQQSRSMFPALNVKIHSLVYESGGEIIYADNFQSLTHRSDLMKSIVGRNIMEFADAPMGGHPRGVFRDALFPADGTVSSLSMVFKDPETSSSLFQGQIPALVDIVNFSGYYIMSLHLQDYYIDRAKGRITEDMTVLLDDSNNIIMACPAFRRNLVDKIGADIRSMDNYIITDNWKDLIDRESKCIQYLTTVRDTSLDAWKVWKQYPDFNRTDWVPDFNGFWQFGKSEIAAFPKEGNGFSLFIHDLDQTKNDLRINIKAKLANTGTIGVLFHLDIYKAGGGATSAPDSDGYNFSLRDINKHNKMTLLLKKDTSPLQDLVLETGLLDVAEDGSIMANISFEKAGAALSLYVNKVR